MRLNYDPTIVADQIIDYGNNFLSFPWVSFVSQEIDCCGHKDSKFLWKGEDTREGLSVSERFERFKLRTNNLIRN